MQVRELNLILIKLVRFTNQKHEHRHDGSMAGRAIRGRYAEPCHATRAAARAACLVRARQGKGRRCLRGCDEAKRDACDVEHPRCTTYTQRRAAMLRVRDAHAQGMARDACGRGMARERWPSDGMLCDAMGWAHGQCSCALGLHPRQGWAQA